MSMSGDFEHRADECMRLAQRAGTDRDRELFLDMAMAWLGLANKPVAAPADLSAWRRNDVPSRPMHLS